MTRQPCFWRFVIIVAWAAGRAGTIPSAYGDDLRAASAAKARVDFLTDVAPILREHCVDCHGPVLQLGDLRLDQRQFVLVEGRDRDLVKPGHGSESLLLLRLTDKKLGLIMPPTFPFFPEDKVGLPDRQIAILKQWIDEGAAWPEEVSLASAAQSAVESPQVKALFAAIRAGDIPNTVSLLADRSLVNARNRYSATPLMHAAMYADVGLMRTLLLRGADIHAVDQGGATALFLAAGELSKVQLLLQHGARVDVRTELGRTPLLVACTYAGNTEVVRLLLKSGAGVAERDKFGETVLTSASKRGDAEMVEVLIAAGADVTSGGGFVGMSPLAWAAEEGNLETIECLLQHGAARDRKGLNGALFAACVRGSTAAATRMLDRGADAAAPAGFAGYTPLMGAAYSETVNVETVKLLLQQGANVNSKAATGDTALKLAQKRGHTEIVTLLKQGGAME